MNNGFKNIFKKKFKIKIFLYVTVSPSACNNEFRATNIINAMEPANTTLVYSRLNASTASSEPINEKRLGANIRPIEVIIMDTAIPYINVCDVHVVGGSCIFYCVKWQ